MWRFSIHFLSPLCKPCSHTISSPWYIIIPKYVVCAKEKYQCFISNCVKVKIFGILLFYILTEENISEILMYRTLSSTWMKIFNSFLSPLSKPCFHVISSWWYIWHRKHDPGIRFFWFLNNHKSHKIMHHVCKPWHE